MGWRDLLQQDGETLVAPWLGGRSLRSRDRTWKIEGRLPREQGWYKFELSGRRATLRGPSEGDTGSLRHISRGYLVGDHLIPDSLPEVETDFGRLFALSEMVHLVEPGLDRFSRVQAGRFFEGGPLVYIGPDFPLGPEQDVLNAYLDEMPNVNAVKGVTPALEAAFNVETWLRQEVERRRREEQERLEQEARERALEEQRQQVLATLGDGQSRRALVSGDFAAAARAALAVGGAQYLDHRPSPNQGEVIVRYRMLDRRLECVCNAETLRIIDSGVCLTDESTGERGDTLFTLESLPAVIAEADRDGVLVVYRHG